MASIRTKQLANGPKAYQVRFRAPDGKERTKQFKRKRDAERGRFLHSIFRSLWARPIGSIATVYEMPSWPTPRWTEVVVTLPGSGSTAESCWQRGRQEQALS